MTYPQHMLNADAAFRCKKWDEAAGYYTKALRALLYGGMLPVWNPSVRFVQERRFECWNRLRRFNA
ncbi:hypothetical protein EVC29_119 [Rhizobium phage RHph_Y52]|nr:hypothetical protein EVC16_119 [Rhizobium phage RHph_Y21]QIG76820.1 hypothetical protein EVC29_119 [Rhizobium phage RHph_Y52]